MGELRHNGDDEKGAWFRVKGSKIGRDGQFAFENKYTTYELGYDELMKKTATMTRYQRRSAIQMAAAVIKAAAATTAAKRSASIIRS